MVVLTTCMSESYMCSACGGQKRVVDPLCPGWDRFFFFFLSTGYKLELSWKRNVNGGFASTRLPVGKTVVHFLDE